MSDLAKRPGLNVTPGRVCAPLTHRHQVGAELRDLYLRGEVASAFAIRREFCAEHRREEWVAIYVRLREPTFRTPGPAKLAIAAGIVLAALGGIAWLIYESRYVLLAALGAVLAGTLAVAIIASRGHVCFGPCPTCGR